MSITVILTNGIIPTPSLGQHMKMVMCQVKDLIQIQPKPCLCQGSNQWPLSFDKECSFKLSDCEEGKSFIVQIKKTRWMRRSKVLHLIQFFLPLENSFFIFQTKLWAQCIWVPKVRTLKVDDSGSRQFSRQASPAPSGTLSTKRDI